MNKIAFILRESQTARFFIPAGLMIIIFSVIFFNASVQNKNYIKTESTVTNVVMDEEAHTDANGQFETRIGTVEDDEINILKRDQWKRNR